MKRFLQVHATRNGELVAMQQREYPEPFDHGTWRELLLEARDEVIREANNKGGCDAVTVHEEDSPGFLRGEG